MKHNICQISSAHKWFDERIFQKQCKSLSRAGYQVKLIIPKERSEIIDSIKIIALPVGLSRLKRILLLGQILIKALRENADLYHIHDPELMLVGILLKLAGKSVIYDVHEDYKEAILSRDYLAQGVRRLLANFVSLLEKITSRFFDYTIVVDSNIQAKFPAKKTERITNVPPASIFCHCRSDYTSGKPLHAVFIGAITKLHGAEKILQAIHFSRYKQNVEIHLIGTIVEPELISLCENTPQVFTHGRLPWSQSLQMLENADIGLFLYQPTPAHLHFTGEGNTKIFEYMGSGLPIIYSDFPPLRNLMESIGCGVPVDPTDPVKIAEAIDMLYENPEYRMMLGNNGREAVRRKYNWDVEEQKLLKVYERVLTPKKRK